MPDTQLTELQLDILGVLWTRVEATVVEVQEALKPKRRLAQSTVATLLARLERRKLVAHRRESRQFYYRATVDQNAVRRSVASNVSSLTNKLFGGDLAQLVSHLLAKGDVQSDELARVREMIEDKERELARKKRRRK